MNPRGLSIIVPCYNEESNVEATVTGLAEVLGQMQDIFPDYEILIIDDCSTDATGKISDELAVRFPFVRVFHNTENRGLGYNYRRGLNEAIKEYAMLVPGDNEFKPVSVRMIAECVGKADIILPYPGNGNIRPLFRQFVSWLFTVLLNLITGYHLKYYNGQALQRRETLKGIEFNTEGFAYQADLLVQLLARGCT